MHANESAPMLLRFGVFEANVHTGELTKQGKRIRLQEQPFQLLVMLLEKPGEVVTREELRSRLWPQTTVDFDHGLNKAISKIREVLGDASGHPRFVETVARRGYRFLADVTVICDRREETAADDPTYVGTPVFSPSDDGTSKRPRQCCSKAFRPRGGPGGCILRVVGFLPRDPFTGDSLLSGAPAGKSFWGSCSGLLR
jgi:DNA-binding winged helix-turn-helix (wHTH) protein